MPVCSRRLLRTGIAVRSGRILNREDVWPRPYYVAVVSLVLTPY